MKEARALRQLQGAAGEILHNLSDFVDRGRKGEAQEQGICVRRGSRPMIAWRNDQV